VLRAEHLDRAGDGQAARAYYAAAKAQSSLYRQDHAIQLATRGLELATEKRDRFEIALLLGDLQSDAGRGTEALEAYTMAQATADSDADRCGALLGSAASNRLIARLDAASDALAEAEPLAASLCDDRALSETHYLRGNLHFARGRLSSVGHNHFWFRRYAIEHALLVQDWDAADRQAESLLLRTVDEPLDYASRIAERGRFLAERGRSGPGKLEETFTALIPLDAMNIDVLSIALRS
jgi:tetratricopeptide (TPR) repeat protein